MKKITLLLLIPIIFLSLYGCSKKDDDGELCIVNMMKYDDMMEECFPIEVSVNGKFIAEIDKSMTSRNPFTLSMNKGRYEISLKLPVNCSYGYYLESKTFWISPGEVTTVEFYDNMEGYDDQIFVYVSEPIQ